MSNNNKLHELMGPIKKGSIIPDLPFSISPLGFSFMVV